MDTLTETYATISLARPVSMPNAFEARGKWRKEVLDAGSVWSRLTESDLLKLEGHQATLEALVQERYGIARDEVDRQVMRFIQDHQSFSL